MIPKVTVVIPTRGRLDHLNRAVTSAAAQTLAANILVVDDARPPSSDLARVIDLWRQELGVSIRYLAAEGAPGGAAARNTGVRHCETEYVAFLDDDDHWHPDKLAAQVGAIGDGVAIFCDFISCNDDGSNPKLIKTHRSELTIGDLLRGNCPSSTSLALVRRKPLLDAGLFDESLRSLQDLDLWFRLAALGHLRVLRRPLASIVEHGGPRISTNVEERMRALDMVCEKYASTFSPADLKRLRRRILSNLFIRLACQSAPLYGRDHAWRSLRADPTNLVAWKVVVRSFLRLGHWRRDSV